MAKGPTNSSQDFWTNFLSEPWHEQKHVLVTIHEGQIMYRQIQEVMDRAAILPPTNSHLRWIHVFSKIGSNPGCKGLHTSKIGPFSLLIWIMQFI